MIHLLLAIIYLAFISLGLPDAVLGAAWPSIYPQFGVPVSYIGVVSMIIAFGTVVSSLQSDRLIRALGTGKVTAISVGMTAAALFGFSISSAFWQLCLWAVPYGLGAGSVDAALNNYVALHYKSRHMSWLHCMWGIGAAAGFASLFYLGITAGRAVCGFLTFRLSDARMIRLGQGVVAIGVVALALPGPAWLALGGFALVGLGCAPIYPSIIHATPAHFGPARSQAMIGVQMASAYVGTCLMPPLFGLLVSRLSAGLLPLCLLVLLALMIATHESLLHSARQPAG